MKLSSPSFASIAALNTQFATGDRRRRDPVWKGSRTSAKVFAPMTRAQRDQLWQRARRFFRHDGDRFSKWILHTLLFDFLNIRTGRLDPSWVAIARAALCSLSTVYRRLKRLQQLGFLTWDKHCSGEMVDGRWQLAQDTNTYRIDANWGELPVPAPDPDTLGRPAIVPTAMELARTQKDAAGVARCLAYDPDDTTAALLLRLKPNV